MRQDLFGGNPVDLSLSILREFEPPEGYWLAFSGGKDSVCLYRLAEMAGVKFDAHYNVTGIDPPELVRFIRDNFPDVVWERPAVNFWKGLKRNGVPLRTSRWCCKELKERGGNGRVVLTGVRAAESAKRAGYGVVHPCRRPGRTATLVNPLLHWTDADVWAFIREEGLTYCRLYDEGFRRLGCVCCPFEANVGRSMERWPKLWARIQRAIVACFEACEWPSMKRFASGEEYFAWWIDRRKSLPSVDDEQMAFDQFGDEEDHDDLQ